jgi:alpha-tubulin suppressor-like RCC1 family protein
LGIFKTLHFLKNGGMKTSTPRTLLLSLLLGATAALFACGGGGGGGGGGDTPPAISVNIFGPDRVVANSRTSYQAQLTGADASQASGFSWAWGDASAAASGNPVQKLWRAPGAYTSTLSATVAGAARTATQAVQVVGQPVAAGVYHSCALKPNGTVACWGRNTFGPLGNGTTTDATTTVAVTGLNDAVAIAAGNDHSCALKTSGTVVCWGFNNRGQLGNGSTTYVTTPVAVNGLSDAVALAAGDNHNCALKTSGAVVCWGENDDGQLGDSSNRNFRTIPVAVTGLSDAVAIQAGRLHSCALKASGAVVCWGDNGYGQLADGSTTDTTTPVAVTGLSDAVAIVARQDHNCALKTSGAVACWGYNGYGQLGDGSSSNIRTTTVAVTGLSDAVALAAGRLHSCALKTSGAMVCWGRNGEGQLGNGSTDGTTTPVAVSGLSDAVAMAGGNAHSCALKASGAVVCWGYNGYGQLGDGTRGVSGDGSTNKSTPVDVLGGPLFWR